MIIESSRKNHEKNKRIEMINSFLNIQSTPQPRPHIILQKKILMGNIKKLKKDNETNTYSLNIQNSNNNRVKEKISLKNLINPSLNIFISNLYDKDFKLNVNKKRKNYSSKMPYIKQNKIINKEKTFIKDNLPLTKIMISTFNKFKGKANKNIIFNTARTNRSMSKDKETIRLYDSIIKRRKNLINIDGKEDCFRKNLKKKKNTFFNNKYLQENTDIFNIGKYFTNKTDVNIKFSEPKTSKNYNIIVDNNISLENTFKEQTVSNFNNKYCFKFKTNNLKEKERIRKLFYFLKKHKDSETDKNCDFLAFHLYKQKKMRKKEINKAILEEFSSPCSYIGRNIDNNFINNEYYSSKNDEENSIIQKRKENKMISIKSLKMNI